MKAFNLPQTRNVGVHPSRRAKWGSARNYSGWILTDSFEFFGEDISEERYQYYCRELRRIERMKNDE